jgi:uncharacterized membrane protein
MSNQPPYGYQPPGEQPPGGYTPPGPSGGKTKTLNLDYNVAGLLCYIPTCFCCINLIACILWLITEPKDNRFVRFHALQGLMLFGVGFVISIIFNVLGVGAQLGTSIGTGSETAGAGAGMLVSLLSFAFGAVMLILHIVSMVKAYQGQMWKIPVIGDIAEKNA